MKVIITGSTGMVGKGVLLECLDSHDVESVLVVNRNPLGISHKKLKEVILKDFTNWSAIASDLKGYNACFFCMGVSAVGLSEADYTRMTYDFTTSAANTMLKENPGMTFIYVSGSGTDTSENGRMMWARVKGRTENALLKMSFKKAYMFRPGMILPKRGIRSRTTLYNILYIILMPFILLLSLFIPSSVTSTTRVGQAMITIARNGSEQTYFENGDINRVAKHGK